PAMLAWYFALRYRTFLNIVERLTRPAIKNENQPRLGSNRNRWDLCLITSNFKKNWRRFRIVIPDIVVDGLEIPFQFTCGGVERHQTIPEKIGAFPIGSIELVGRRAIRQIDNS